jgi:hypothetical protein
VLVPKTLPENVAATVMVPVLAVALVVAAL